MLAPALDVLVKDFYVMGKALAGKLSCMLTDLVYFIFIQLLDPPCKNGERMMDYAEAKVCGKILEHLREKPYDDACG